MFTVINIINVVTYPCLIAIHLRLATKTDSSLALLSLLYVAVLNLAGFFAFTAAISKFRNSPMGELALQDWLVGFMVFFTGAMISAAYLRPYWPQIKQVRS